MSDSKPHIWEVQRAPEINEKRNNNNKIYI